MFKGAIFDMDGVLVDNMKVHMEAFAELARRHGAAIDIAHVLSLAGKGNAELFEETFPREVLESVGIDALGREKEAIYRELYAPRLAPTGGLMAFLDELRARGVRLAVGTSAPKANLDFVFDGLGLRSRFDAVIDAEMVTRCKPDPEIYLRAVAELGLTAAECLVFEDAVAGIESARAAGVEVVALSTSIPAERLEGMPGVALVIPDFTGVNFARLNDLLN